MARKTPKPKEFDDIARGYAVTTMRAFDIEVEKRHILPLCQEGRHVLERALYALARASISTTATLALTGTDVTFAVLPPAPTSEPPSPV